MLLKFFVSRHSGPRVTIRRPFHSMLWTGWSRSMAAIVPGHRQRSNYRRCDCPARPSNVVFVRLRKDRADLSCRRSALKRERESETLRKQRLKDNPLSTRSAERWETAVSAWTWEDRGRETGERQRQARYPTQWCMCSFLYDTRRQHGGWHWTM